MKTVRYVHLLRVSGSDHDPMIRNLPVDLVVPDREVSVVLEELEELVPVVPVVHPNLFRVKICKHLCGE